MTVKYVSKVWTQEAIAEHAGTLDYAWTCLINEVKGDLEYAPKQFVRSLKSILNKAINDRAEGKKTATYQGPKNKYTLEQE